MLKSGMKHKTTNGKVHINKNNMFVRFSA